MPNIPDVIINEGARKTRNFFFGGAAISGFFSAGAFSAGDPMPGMVLALIAGGATLIASKIKYRYRLKGGVAVYE